MRIDVLTIFPEMFGPVLGSSIVGRAQQANLVEIVTTDIREYTNDKHNKVDDRPFGGGPGMVMACQPVWDAVQAVEPMDARPVTRVLMTPPGPTAYPAPCGATRSAASFAHDCRPLRGD